jgi:O-antigen/teichoic acid export membrane protein
MSFLKDSFIYTISTFLSKGISFFLLPFYTRIFTPEDYGVLDIIAISISILSLLFSCQMDQGVARFLVSSKSIQSKKSYATVGLFHFGIMFGICSTIIFLARLPIATHLLGRPDLSNAIGLASIFMFTEMIYYFFQNQLKWEFKSKQYAIISICKVILNISLVLVLSGVMHLKFTGVYLGSIITNIILLGPLYYFTHHSIDISFASSKRWKKMMIFSVPLIFSSLAINLFQYSDRFLIQKMLSLSELGIYSIGVKIASVTLILFNGFSLAFGPYVYQNFKNPDAKDTIRKIFNGIFVISGLIVLGLSAFASEILIVMTTKSFYKAASVIPLIVTSNVLYYLGINFSIGISIAKKNQYYIYINVIGLILNIFLNITLIPKWGVIGASAATFISLLIITGLSIYVSQKVHHIPYEFKKIFMLSLWMVLSMTLSAFFGKFPISLSLIALKTLMILAYIGIAAFLFRQETLDLLKKANHKFKVIKTP